MKNIFKAIIAIIITISIVIFSTVPVYCQDYTRTGFITSVNRSANEWTVLDTTGNLWTFEDGEDLIEKDIIIMEMDDNSTPVIYDDIITHVFYIGYYE